MTTPVYVFTCEKSAWTLQPFAYLFNLFWSPDWPVIVAGERKQPAPLPPNFSWWSYGKEWPADRWSNGVMRFLEKQDADVCVLLLDDYWLVREVDVEGIDILAGLARETPDLLRIDLTDDRQYNGDSRDVGYCGRFDLVETPGDSPYQMSLQAGIWRRDLLLSVLRPDLSPWQVELFLSPTLHERQDLRVLGTRQRPVRYANATKGGAAGEVVQEQWALIHAEQREYIKAQGWLP